jgi:hypothetical protein
MRSDEKHVCPDHDLDMRYGATLWDFPEDLTLNGVNFKNQFYYCSAPHCGCRCSDATGHINAFDLDQILRGNAINRSKLLAPE